MKALRIWLARRKVKRIHAEIDVLDSNIRHAAHSMDALLTQERIARSRLFNLEHPHLFVNRPSCVYGAAVIPLPTKPTTEQWKPSDK